MARFEDHVQAALDSLPPDIARALEHPEAGGGVAFFAHVGGFVFGALTVFLVAKRRPLRPSY